MKINTKQLEALRQQQEQAPAGRVLTPSGGGFEAALVRQMGLGNAGTAPGEATNPPAAVRAGQASQASMISQMLLGVTPTENVGDNAAHDALDQASGALDMWDSYVTALNTSGQGSLRDAYALLQGIDGQVAALRENTAPVRGRNPGFDSLLNDLEVLTTTEKFKFNRGDYNV